MKRSFAEVSKKGKVVRLPAVEVDHRTVVVSGGWLKTAELFDEHWLPYEVTNPASFVAELKAQRSGADIFTFGQKLPHTKPSFDYRVEWDNVAVIPLSTYTDWWENRLPQETRKHVRKAQKLGVQLREVTMDDSVAAGLKAIYDESPVRQGRKFWHYGKPVEQVKQENSSYLDRSILVAAFVDTELIGLLKLVLVGTVAEVMQIIAKGSHIEKKPTNALIAKGVELCIARGATHFVYGKYVYGTNTTGQLTEFKRRNGFERVDLPRYYVPLTATGRLAIASGLHLGLRHLLPASVDKRLRDMRTKLLHSRVAGAGETQTAKGAK